MQTTISSTHKRGFVHSQSQSQKNDSKVVICIYIGCLDVGGVDGGVAIVLLDVWSRDLCRSIFIRQDAVCCMY